jgi:hypothetical protein
MRQVHDFTLGDSFADIVEEQFVRHTQVQRGDRDAGSHPTRADNRDSPLHVPIPAPAKAIAPPINMVAIIGYVSWMQPATAISGLLILLLAWVLPKPSASPHPLT